MKRRMIYSVSVLLLGAAVTLAMKQAFPSPAVSPAVSSTHNAPTTSSSAHLATTHPADAPVLPGEFSVLQTRSAFGHGRGGAGGGPAGGPEATLVVKGVVQSDLLYTAFIEDLGSKSVVQASAGDPLARGRIKSIGLDAIVYEVSGNCRRIEVGQNLNQEVIAPPPPATQPTQPAASPGGPDGPPGSNPPPPDSEQPPSPPPGKHRRGG